MDRRFWEGIAGSLVPVSNLSRRVSHQIAEVRRDYAWVSNNHTSLIIRCGVGARWVTFGGGQANAAIAERLSSELGCGATWDNFAVRLKEGLPAEALVAGVQAVRAADEERLPPASEQAVEGLQFGECMSPGQAVATVRARLSDPVGVNGVRAEPLRVVLEAPWLWDRRTF